MKQLTRKHLGLHGLSPRDYKKKWGFSMRQSLSAKSLSRARSRAAKKRGLPENLVKFQEGRKHKAPPVSPSKK
jgi:predicted transcriptional regulator